MLRLIPDRLYRVADGQAPAPVEGELQAKRPRDLALERLSGCQEPTGPLDHGSRGAGRSSGFDVTIDKVSPADRRIAADVLRVIRELQPDADVVGKPLRLHSVHAED